MASIVNSPGIGGLKVGANKLPTGDVELISSDSTLLISINQTTKQIDFKAVAESATNTAFTPNGDITSNTVQNAIVEVRDDTDIKLALKENLSNKDTDVTLAANSDTKYPSQKAVKTFGLSLTGGIPQYVYLNRANKIEFNLSKDGLLIQSLNSATQTNVAGGFVGGGVGNKAFVEFGNPSYENMLLSNLSTLKFTAKNIRDTLGSTIQGVLFWNLIVNFANGDQPLLTEFANIVWDGLPDVFTQYFVIPSVFTEFTADLVNARAFKVVGGTGLITVTGTTTSGSDQVTAISNINALTVGNYFRKIPAGTGLPETTPIPDGTTIIAINTGASSLTLSANATLSQAGITLNEYGGTAPVNRSSTAINGNPTFPVTNTQDLRVGMHVSGTGVAANSAILSLVANTSITLNKNANASGATTLSFVATGKSGIPANGQNLGITWARIVANNPSAYFVSSDPSLWTVTDGGFPKGVKMFPFNFCMNDSSRTDTRTNALKSVTINSDTYTFSQ